MDPAITQGMAGVSLAIILFGMLLGILWILVPFAIFGIKPLLRRLSDQLESIEKQNADVLVALRELRHVPPVVVRDDRPML